MKNLTAVIERSIADAIYAGAEWRAIASGVDSAEIGRTAKRWPQDRQYQLALQQCQQRATKEIAQAIMRMRLTAETVAVEQRGLGGGG